MFKDLPQSLSPHQIATVVNADQIHLMVDLTGYSLGATVPCASRSTAARVLVERARAH